MATKKPVKVVKKAPAKKTLQDFAEKVAEKVKEVVKSEPVIEAPPELAKPAPPDKPEKPPRPDVAPPKPEKPEEEVSINEIAEQAWNAVRGDDASYEDSRPDFQMVLLYAAETVQSTHAVLEGDTHLARFEQEVYRILIGG